MTHPGMRYFPIPVAIPRLFFGRGFCDLVSGFYDPFPDLVSYGLVSGTDCLSVPGAGAYGFLFKVRPGP